MNGDFSNPMLFTAETPQTKFVAYIDPDNKFCTEDKLSQVGNWFKLGLLVKLNINILSFSYEP